MGSVGTGNQQYNDPSWLSNFLQQHAGEQINVNTGPGGVTIQVGTESVFIGPSQTGVTQTFKGYVILTSGDIDPSLPFIVPGTTQFTLSNSWSSYFVNYISRGGGTGDPFGLDFSEGSGKSLPSGLTMPTPTDLTSTDANTVYKALLQFTGVDNNSALTDDQKAAFKDTLKGMAQQLAEENKIGGSPDLASGDMKQITDFLTGLIPSNSKLSPGDLEVFSSILGEGATAIAANEYTSGLSSTDKTTVYSSLLAFTGFDKDPNLNPAQQTAFQDTLQALAQNIALQNASGKPDLALLSFDPQTLATYLVSKMDLSSLSADDKVLFQSAMGVAAGSIASLNAASGKPAVKPELMQNMQSTDPTVVLDALITVLKTQGLTENNINTIMANLMSMARIIAQKNAQLGGAGLDIANSDSLKAALIALMGSDFDPTNTAFVTAIGLIANEYSSVNTKYYNELTRSTDPDIVYAGLLGLSNVLNNPNLTPAQVSQTMDYLKLMAAALAFMSKVRAKISIMEAEFRKQETEGKLANIRDQTKVAQNAYTSGIKELETNLKKILDSLAQAALWKWLGPLIMVFLAIIMIAMTIATGPAGLALMGPIMVAVMVATIVAMSTVMVLQQTTGFMTKMAEAMGIKDKAAQDALSFGVQALILAIMIVATLGAATGLAMAQILSTVTIRAMITELMNVTVGTVIATTVGLVTGIVVQSGLLNDALMALFKKMGLNEQQAAIASMVTTIVLMLVMMFAMMAAAPSMGGNATRSASTTGTAVGTNAVAQATTSVATNTSDEIMQMLLNMLNKIKNFITDPNVIMQIVQVLAQLATVAAEIQQGIFNFGQADISRRQASLAEIQSKTQALLDELKSLMPTFDMTLDELDQDAKDFFSFYTGLMNMFASMVASASDIVTNASNAS